MRNDRHYEICLAISNYMKLFYPKVIYHFDYAGLHLTKAQAGKMKEIQGDRGYPDLFIAEPRGHYHGFYIELKNEGEKLYKKDGITPISEHIAEQIAMMTKLYLRGYYTNFAIGFDDAKYQIDKYLK
jgi:hypothetical protein